MPPRYHESGVRLHTMSYKEAAPWTFCPNKNLFLEVFYANMCTGDVNGYKEFHANSSGAVKAEDAAPDS